MADGKPVLPDWLPIWVSQALEFTSAYGIDIFGAAWVILGVIVVAIGILYKRFFNKTTFTASSTPSSTAAATANGTAAVGTQLGNLNGNFTQNNYPTDNETFKEVLNKLLESQQLVGKLKELDKQQKKEIASLKKTTSAAKNKIEVQNDQP